MLCHLKFIAVIISLGKDSRRGTLLIIYYRSLPLSLDFERAANYLKTKLDIV